MEKTSLIIHESTILARYEFSFVEHRIKCHVLTNEMTTYYSEEKICIYNPNKAQNDITQSK